MAKSPISSILANLGSKLATSRSRDSINKISTGRISAGGQNAGQQSMSNSLKARSDSWRAAANNARPIIEFNNIDPSPVPMTVSSANPPKYNTVVRLTKTKSEIQIPPILEEDIIRLEKDIDQLHSSTKKKYKKLKE
mgnify:CR=1 FL=1